MKHVIADPVRAALDTGRPFGRFFEPGSFYDRLEDEPEVSNFALGDPQDMPLPEYVEALRRWTIPRNKDWFSYTLNRPEAQAVVAASLRERTGMPFEAEDVAMTTGAFGGLAVTLRTLTGAGDDVIFMSPPWFNYESMIITTGATPRKVRVDIGTFDLDLDALADALSPRTRAVIINTPNNPTGKIYPLQTLEALGALLASHSERSGRPTYLISDESYNRIVYDDRPFHSPLEFYPYAFLVYTYGKTLLTPGERLGYIALPPTMPDREYVRAAIASVQVNTGWIFPNAILQYALAELEALSIDIGRLQRRRDRLAASLGTFGYDVRVPEGTFYMMARSPWRDDWAFAEKLASHRILVLPGSVVDMPGHFRLSLTASDEMLERALPDFEAATAEAENAN
ncbi:MAG: aminotransferase class I/II-fold pyridoxal phosphate-dependent enzyme [Gammaproteobacteria bacterium]|nr:aminotransferase class I/II-fold pyridoxal phosphate-dependent enzyme [Gammaproteobacteria bacterium]NIR84896.1 aminotransferase class I/II-fold pyridoxal phosphate-dependent enzyme [Gammaproteobacteria bacterium]NIR91745.1 aminotransferase class I/II-fold pyridoxal phosphate-dependent enzyme [Gammaproteobacteria bacterium]NIU05943.1 aminotransferase class I/II-fold pyridoxal phosphate-dependent enzyme [Gammaproteobacteria bacterium]NIV52990.1 aminotransferase class I/II-fold pyridoxal phosp